ncbi:hypothetical protein GCM10010285_62330 [Streptomyces pseudogriseolus]|uniref:Uncharacterized protein n=1 Tax=Streptomyces pseudogriseolus TaxID=36817 RepID=A0ABQ2TNN2_STREZ|nr:hypothetical protein GCM10010285_62330 [Streptomyces rubiginosus]
MPHPCQMQRGITGNAGGWQVTEPLSTNVDVSQVRVALAITSLLKRWPAAAPRPSRAHRTWVAELE